MREDPLRTALERIARECRRPRRGLDRVDVDRILPWAEGALAEKPPPSPRTLWGEGAVALGRAVHRIRSICPEGRIDDAVNELVAPGSTKT